MSWICPKCGKETLEMVDATYNKPSYFYCRECNEKVDFADFIAANKDRMQKRRDCKDCEYYHLTEDKQETCIVDLIKRNGAHELIHEDRTCDEFEFKEKDKHDL